MVAKGSKDGTVRFSVLPRQEPRQVLLAGDFNGWKGRKMVKGKNGAFVAVVPLKPGTYEYKFVIDGQWVPDADNPVCGPNVYGTANSIVAVS